MKKLLISLVLLVASVVGVMAEESNVSSDKTPITFTLEQGVTNIYFKGASSIGMPKFLCEAPGSGVVPNGKMAICVGKKSATPVIVETTGTPLTYKVDLGNPSLETTGKVLSVVGSVATGAGLGLALVAIMNHDMKSAGLFSLAMVAPGIATISFGFSMQKKNSPKLILMN